MATILCLGDSHTRGFYGSDWVYMLQAELGRDVKLVRAGVDGQLVRNIGARAAKALADAQGKGGNSLAAVVLFCGTNDALACCSPDWRQFHERTTRHVLPGEQVSADSFEADVRRVVALALVAAVAPLSSLPVALVTLPPLDEHDFASGPGNAVVRELNARLAKIAADKEFKGVALIDLFSALEHESRRRPPPARQPLGAPPPAAHAPGAMVRGGMVALARRYVLRQPWDSVAAANGGRLLTDRIHLSDAAGRILSGLLLPWAKGAMVAAARASG